ncbi:novel immune-type receptor 5 [Danio aesculapii]|uniref:novel immune-type receptor 5 n=1 Tax=Danio aesculapii TaxID=1142201 RepID=UPI0024C0E70C|nr:novel immune-type receptor 5 [Danio aesculapii]
MNKQLCAIIFLLYEVSETVYGNIRQPDTVLSFQEGDTAFLHCFITDSQMSMTLWYKQVTGEEPRLIASSIYRSSEITFHNEFDSSHFEVLRDTGGFNLKIANAVQSDSGTYYCATSFSNVIKFGNGTRLVINGTKISKPTNLQLRELEQAESEVKKPLHCSVQNQLVRNNHRFLWFSDGSEESPPGFIHIHGNSSKSCDGSSESDCHSPTCIYNLPMKRSRSSDMGMYYCAVARCGQALFGNVSKLSADAVGSPKILFIQIGLAVLLAISLAINILLCCLRKNGRKSQIQTTDEDDDNDLSINQFSEVTYATVKTSSKYSRVKRESKQEDTLYSGLACQQHS